MEEVDSLRKRIVFVDDEPHILSGLKRSLRGMREGWDMEFYSSPEEALAAIRRAPTDVVVSDMRMPQLDGAALLTEVKQLRPGCIRIILSGQAQRELILRSLAVTHVYLDKPCDPAALQSVIERTKRWHELVADPGLQRAITKIDKIPSLPDSYQLVTTAIRDGKSSAEEVGQLIARDVGMSARILQIANSAVFHFRRPIEHVTQAATMLGTERIEQLVLSVGVFSVFNQSADVNELTEIWRRSLASSVLATRIAGDLGLDRRVSNTASTAAMLSECGRLVLLSQFPERCATAKKQAAESDASLSEAEQREFGTDQALVGAYVCSLWGLPDDVVDSIAFHNTPRRGPHKAASALTAVHAGCGLIRDPSGETLDQAYLESLGAEARMPVWQEWATESLGAAE